MTLLVGSAPQLRCLEYWTQLDPYETSSLVEQLPATNGQLTQLTSLTLGQVDPAQIISMLQGLPSLLYLYLDCKESKTELHCLSDIARSCPALMHLNITGALLEDVPSEIGDLRSLTRLCIKDCDIDTVSDSISQLTGLLDLDFFEMFLTGPTVLAALRQLTSLKLSDDGPELPSLKCLRSLAVGICEEGVPTYFTQLTELTHLCLHFEISCPCPEMAGMTRLRRVEIHGYRLPQLLPGAYLCGVTNLYLQDQYPRGVPAALEAAVQLRVLSFGIDSTDLTEPDLVLLSQLPVLETLYISKPVSVSQQQWDTNTALLMTKRAALGHTPLVPHACRTD